MKAGKTRPARPLTPEERRLALIRTQRETARVVKRTLVGIAPFAFKTRRRRMTPPSFTPTDNSYERLPSH